MQVCRRPTGGEPLIKRMLAVNAKIFGDKLTCPPSTSLHATLQVCPTRGEYVEPLLKKMLAVDAKRLSRGSTQPEAPAAGGPEGVPQGVGAGARAGVGAGAGAAGPGKRNDTQAVSAARERYLSRKAQLSGGRK